MTLDIALGGGYPRGRVIEIYGPESSGKTTLALHALAEVQKTGGVAAFIDAEHALDPAYAERLGVDVSEMLVSQPDSGGFDCFGRWSVQSLSGARLCRHGVLYPDNSAARRFRKLLNTTPRTMITPSIIPPCLPCKHGAFLGRACLH